MHGYSCMGIHAWIAMHGYPVSASGFGYPAIWAALGPYLACRRRTASRRAARGANAARAVGEVVIHDRLWWVARPPRRCSMHFVCCVSPWKYSFSSAAIPQSSSFTVRNGINEPVFGFCDFTIFRFFILFWCFRFFPFFSGPGESREARGSPGKPGECQGEVRSSGEELRGAPESSRELRGAPGSQWATWVFLSWHELTWVDLSWLEGKLSEVKWSEVKLR